jgi:hypothetical protein
MSEWYYRVSEHEQGPVGAAELLRLVRERVIDAETLVRKNDSAWFPASQVGGLFEAAAKPSVTYCCPQCGTSVGKPPTYCRRCRRLLDYARPIFTEHEIDGYEPPPRERESIADSWKQWVRRLKAQREERTGGGISESG